MKEEILNTVTKIILPYLQHHIPLLVYDVLIFLPTMAVVYTIGRMLMLTKSDRIKNSLALISILFFNWFINLSKVQNVESISDMIIHSSIGILLYVLIGFRLFDRVDSFLDKHFGKDKRKKQ